MTDNTYLSRRNALMALSASVLATVSLPHQALAAKSAIYLAPFSNKAVSGFDCVAYFTKAAPTKGLEAHSFDYMGAKWLFSSAENLAKFKASPTAYAPKYGGYCAWAAAQGYLASGNPNNWDVYKGKLYLNYDSNIQKRWRKDIPGFIADADKNWPGILA